MEKLHPDMERNSQPLLLLTNGRFKPGTFFVSSIIFRAKHELTSKAVSKSICDERMLENGLLDRSLKTTNNKASDAVSKKHQQLQKDHDIARASYFRSGRGHVTKQQRSHDQQQQ